MTETVWGMTADADWRALEHAYGSAEDVPGLLHAMESADADAREEAMEELVSSLCHQGSIYTASAAALPHLARLALHGPGHRRELLWLVGGIADGAGSRAERAAVRRAMAETLPSLLPLVADDAPAVRQAMVWLIAAAGDVALPLMPLLRARLDEEKDAEVRADVVTALGLLDLDDTARTARATALLHETEEPAAVRLAAVTDLLRTAPLPLPPDLVRRAVAVHREHPVVQHGAQWPEPYRTLADRLLDDPDAALLAVTESGGVLPSAGELVERWRDCERAVLPWLVAELAYPHQLHGLARLGETFPGGEEQPWLVPHLAATDPALRTAAVVAAVRFRVPGALAHVLRLLDELPSEQGTELAVRAAAEVYGPAAEPLAARVADLVADDVPAATAWAGVLDGFPQHAARCLPTLVRLAPKSEEACAVLAGAHEAPEVIPALRAAAEAGGEAAAFAYLHATGEPRPALARVRAALRTDRAAAALPSAGRLGPAGAELLPDVEPHLKAVTRERRAAAAAAVWRITGRTDDTAPLLADVVVHGTGPAGPRLDALRALTEMALLPDAARPTVDALAHGRRRMASALPLLDDGARHPDSVLREAAVRLLDAVHGGTLP
ncbi:hypothetical protein [Streptomyces tritici]|uniref:hypothetical protein n=1 Tax=Streptomyces tritici TaxID=2054410 RepID=UPI003AF01181